MATDRQPWKDSLARIIARARHGPGVDMGGKHNPKPSEQIAANQFVDDMLDALNLDTNTPDETSLRCVYCAGPLYGGKGDYWHIQDFGTVESWPMKCPDGKHLGQPSVLQ